jgi:hypothetical protein
VAVFAQVATTQLFAAALGFWIRGGITIGELVHNNDVVFGPALNRAHELESKVAEYPRIIFDPVIFPVEIMNTQSEISSIEGEIAFLDPFSPGFIGVICKAYPDVFDKYFDLGFSVPPNIIAHTLLLRINQLLENEIPHVEEPERKKLVWLNNRVRRGVMDQDAFKKSFDAAIDDLFQRPRV